MQANDQGFAGLFWKRIHVCHHMEYFHQMRCKPMIETSQDCCHLDLLCSCACLYHSEFSSTGLRTSGDKQTDTTLQCTIGSVCISASALSAYTQMRRKSMIKTAHDCSGSVFASVSALSAYTQMKCKPMTRTSQDCRHLDLSCSCACL